MGNRYGARDDEFAWNLGRLRRLRRYILEGKLTHDEAATLLGTTRGSVSSAVTRYALRVPPETQAEYRERARHESATHGRRSKYAEDRSYWDAKLIETWAERKARRQRERDGE